MRANLLSAAEKRVDAKIADLKSLEDQIQTLLGKRDEAEKKQVTALVKVYSAMKPRDAARIFNTLDEAVLLDVARQMKPDSLAAIMAAMNPQPGTGPDRQAGQPAETAGQARPAVGGPDSAATAPPPAAAHARGRRRDRRPAAADRQDAMRRITQSCESEKGPGARHDARPAKLPLRARFWRRWRCFAWCSAWPPPPVPIR